MIDEKYSDLIIDWLDDNLSPERKKELDRLLAEGFIDFGELEELKKLHSDIEQVPVPAPGESMRLSFYQWLSRQHKPVKNRLVDSLAEIFGKINGATVRRMAYAAFILVFGFTAGMLYRANMVRTQEIENLNMEINSMKAMMVLTLLDQSSSFERLKAVSLSSGIDNKDHRVINALFQTLNNDPNVNVRLAALEALSKRGQDPMVRKNLVLSIDKQQSPIIQVAMADVMLSLNDKNSVQKFQQLLKKQDLNKTVRVHLEHTISKLL